MNTDDWLIATGRVQEPIFEAELYMKNSYGSGFTLSLPRKLTKRQQRMWKKWFGLDYKELKNELRFENMRKD